ncbi:rRNA adenine N-6-methyltransferase family protein, partial [Enterococcus faecalis]|uniref:rRNA adenine N-6-methyltransferase family protein n=1 Tax=Enterococcus faecalis TaxID=1351 RepID=UPI001F50DA57
IIGNPSLNHRYRKGFYSLFKTLQQNLPDKYWKLYTYFVSKWVNREYRQLFTKNQFHQAMKHAKVNNLSTVTYEQVLSIFNSYLLFNGRK